MFLCSRDSLEAGAAGSERWADPGEFATWLAEAGLPFVSVHSRVTPAHSGPRDGWSASFNRELVIHLRRSCDVARVAEALDLGALDVKVTLTTAIRPADTVTHELHRSGAWGFFSRVDLVVVSGSSDD